MDEKVLEKIVNSVIAEMQKTTGNIPSAPVLDEAEPQFAAVSPENSDNIADITSAAVKAVPLLEQPADRDALLRMMKKTSARIGVGRAGPREKTQTLLALRADHAAARDAVFIDVDENFVQSLNLFTVQTKCSDRNEFLTRPDLGRQFDDAALNDLKSKCQMNPDVQIFASDGLSSKAIEANLSNVLPALIDGVKAKGLTVGVPFFVKFGRVGTMDRVAETLGAKVTCILVGERPGLGSAESMSAYIAYDSKVGMPESNRTVVSNIYDGGITPVEAGAYIADVIKQIYDSKASGVNLKK